MRQPAGMRALLPLLLAAAPAAAHARQTFSLDGPGWSLTLDPNDAATKRIAAKGGKVKGPIV